MGVAPCLTAHSFTSKQATIDELTAPIVGVASSLMVGVVSPLRVVPKRLAGSAGLRSKPGAHEQRYPPGMLVHWAPMPHGLFLHSSISVCVCVFSLLSILVASVRACFVDFRIMVVE